MKKRIELLLLIICLFLAGCIGEKYLSINEIETILEKSKLEDFQECDALNILTSTDWIMKINENWKIDTSKKVHKIVKVFRNFDEVANIKIPIYDSEEIYELYARVIKPDGTVIKLQNKDFYDIIGSDNEQFYTDIKFKKFTFPALEKDCIIEYYYKKYVDIPFLRDIWLLEDSNPIIQNRYTLTIPQILLTKGKFKWLYKSYNQQIPEAKGKRLIATQQHEKDIQLILEWEFDDIPAFESEPLMPGGLTEFKHVRFAPGFFETWNELASWYYEELFKPQMLITEKIKEKAKDIAGITDTEQSKIEECYRYVQKMRYVSINLNNGGIVPDNPEKILVDGYGDCKNKSMLLISFLKSLDIKSEPVLLLTKDAGYIDSKFPSWYFNHMIVKATTSENQIFWLDPTSEFCDKDKLPAMDEGINVLVLHEDGTCSIERTPSSNYTENVKEIHIDYELNSKTEPGFMVNIFKGSA